MNLSFPLQHKPDQTNLFICLRDFCLICLVSSQKWDYGFQRPLPHLPGIISATISKLGFLCWWKFWAAWSRPGKVDNLWIHDCYSCEVVRKQDFLSCLQYSQTRILIQQLLIPQRLMMISWCQKIWQWWSTLLNNCFHLLNKTPGVVFAILIVTRC